MTYGFLKNRFFTKHHISGLLFLTLSFLNYMPRYIVWVVLLLGIVTHMIRNRGELLFPPMPGGVPYAFLLLLGILQGTAALIRGDNEPWPFFRDIILVTFVYFLWFVADIIGRRTQYDKRTLYVTLFFFCGTSIFISLVTAIPQLISLASTGSKNYTISRINSYMMSIGLYLCIFRPPEVGKYYFSKKIDFMLRAVIVLGFILAFSRTTLLIFLCLIIVKGIQYPIQLLKIIIATVALLLIVSIAFPTITDAYLDKIARSLTEVSSTAAKWDHWSIVNNWRGYEVYAAKKNFASYSLVKQLIGGGFGSGISVYGYEYLVTGENTLALLHNGYYTMLLKEGFVGLALNAIYILALAMYCLNLKRKSYEGLLSFGLLLGIVFSTAVISGPLWGNASFEMMLIMCWGRQKKIKDMQLA